jgi:shikimate dehydrogenase|tara:strand:+ start:6757 stop:7596 length:840 start_codon:yes stop_codon:yes gene_type:complete
MTDIFEFSHRKPRFAVIGNPVSHSKSPEIHRLFGKQVGIELDYTAIHVDSGGLDQAIRNMQAGGLLGLNITIPFKEKVYALSDRLSPSAEIACAVNTVRFDPDDIVFGDNTDGIGLLKDLESNLNREISDSRLLIIGAGGAVRGILGPLLSAEPASLVIANRTFNRAVSLTNSFSWASSVSASSFDQLHGKKFDIIINGTSSSLTGENLHLPNTIFSKDSLAYDMMYGDKETPFMSWARANGVGQAVDGLGMLVEQAAASFELWHHERPDTLPVIRSLR